MIQINKIRLTIIVLITFCYQNNFAQTKDNTFILGLKNSKVFKETIFPGFKHFEIYKPKHIKSKITPEFRIKNESQTGITIRPIINGTNNYNVPICTFDSYLIDEEYEKFVNKCFLQIGEHDFNNDGIAEIIILFGLKGKYLNCSVYQYYEPANISDIDRIENWNKISEFDEIRDYNIENLVEVFDNKIYLPYGIRGLKEEYIYNDRGFIKVN